LKQDDFYNNTF